MTKTDDTTKLNVILDLDETLVSAYPVEEFPFNDAQVRDKIINYTFHNMESYYIIFERPKLQEFLDYLFKNFNVSVWSAGSKDYVSFIVHNVILKKGRKLDYLFWSHHCKESTKKFKSKKNLKLLWDIYKLPEYTKKNTLLIDDMEDTYKVQKKNCIRALEFDVLETKKDSHLEDVKKVLRKYKKSGTV